MSHYYRGKSVWIIGGSQGIGLALAQKLHSLGAKLTLLARNAEALQQAAAPLQADTRVLDIADWQQTQETLSQLGTPDLVFNCAGLALPGYLIDVSVDDIVQMNSVNYLGTVHVCKAVLPAMLAAKRGHIVNVSSIGGFLGLFGYTGYCGTKYAVMGFSEALKREVAPFGIAVSVVCPPNTKTPGLAAENLRKPAEVLAQEEKVQALEPEQVADYILKKLPSRPFVVIPSWDGRMVHRLSRFLPALVDLFLKRPPATSPPAAPGSTS